MIIKQRYFKLRDSIPGLEPQLFIGNLWQTAVIAGESLYNVWLKMHRIYGDIYQYWIGFNHFYVFNKLEHAIHILYECGSKYERTETALLMFRSFQPNGLEAIKGVAHKQLVRLLGPLFRKTNMPSYTNEAIECIDGMITSWCRSIDKIPRTDLVDQFSLLSFDLVAKQLFAGYDLQVWSDQSNHDAHQLLTSMSDIARHVQIIARYCLPEPLANVFVKTSPSFRRAVRTVNRIADKIVDHLFEQQENQQQDQFMDEDDTGIEVRTKSLKDLSPSSKQSGTLLAPWRKQVSDWILSFLGGSFDTTSVYAWFVYYMSKYPEVQASIKRELAEHGIDRRATLPITSEIIASLDYVECVLKEVLRHAPIIEHVQRQVICEDELDGVSLHVGDQVLIPLASIHRSPKLWHHPAGPDAFVPERFLTDDKHHHPQALVIFGGGHRRCIGQHLARFHLKLFIVRTMQMLTFHDAPGNEGTCLTNITGVPSSLIVRITFDNDAQ
ncbi:unnamed protein product [Rotaria sp. Silwood2]|nr:unnamed protein product [Rotaria sp. Silwood2]CAF4470853.1 unnamed protein product [Rotaria sp. Silwood2]